MNSNVIIIDAVDGVDPETDEPILSNLSLMIKRDGLGWLGLIDPEFEFTNTITLRQLAKEKSEKAQYGKHASTIMTHIHYFLGRIISNEMPKINNNIIAHTVSFKDKKMQDEMLAMIDTFEKQAILKKAA